MAIFRGVYIANIIGMERDLEPVIWSWIERNKYPVI
jgi:hypothetical protein